MRERKCDMSGTRKNSKCMSVSKSNVHTHRVQHANLHWRKMWWPEGRKMVQMRISARTIKTIAKFGLHATALKYGVDLNKFSISFGGYFPDEKNIAGDIAGVCTRSVAVGTNHPRPAWVSLLHPAKQLKRIAVARSTVTVSDSMDSISAPTNEAATGGEQAGK